MKKSLLSALFRLTSALYPLPFPISHLPSTVSFLLILLLLAGCNSVELAHPAQARPPAPAPPTLAPEVAASVVLAEWNGPPQPQRLRRVDPATGRDTASGRPIDLGPSEYIPVHRFAADGRTLAVVAGSRAACDAYAGGSRCRAAAETLHLIDLPAWREVSAPLAGRGWAGLLAFNPAATRLALVYNEPGQSSLILFDAATGQPAARRDLPFPPDLLAYTGDGSALVLYGAEPGQEPGILPPGPPQALLLDAATLNTRWQQSLPDVTAGHWCQANCAAGHGEQAFVFWQPAAVLSAGADRLYIVHADADRLTTVDFTAQTVRQVEIGLALTGWERLLALTAGLAQAKGDVDGAVKEASLSADGQRLYITGQELAGMPNPGATALGLRVVEVESGRVVTQSERDTGQVRLGPDGSLLLLENWTGDGPQTDIVAAETLTSLARLEGWEVVTGRRLDGRPVLLARRPGRLGLLDPQTFAITPTWPAASAANWLEWR